VVDIYSCPCRELVAVVEGKKRTSPLLSCAIVFVCELLAFRFPVTLSFRCRCRRSTPKR